MIIYIVRQHRSHFYIPYPLNIIARYAHMIASVFLNSTYLKIVYADFRSYMGRQQWSLMQILYMSCCTIREIDFEQKRLFDINGTKMPQAIVVSSFWIAEDFSEKQPEEPLNDFR